MKQYVYDKNLRTIWYMMYILFVFIFLDHVAENKRHAYYLSKYCISCPISSPTLYG